MNALSNAVCGAVSMTALFGLWSVTAVAQSTRDTGVRGGPAGAGLPFANLPSGEQGYFDAGHEDFAQIETLGEGLGPRFNLDACGGCHQQPALGGSAPAVNPQFAAATAFGARNAVPSFITMNGPVREARFKFKQNGSRDGGVHDLFTVSGRVDAGGNASACNIAQDDFAAHLARNNVSFRIPTPLFGTGLIEAIPESNLRNNLGTDARLKARLGISGRFNRNGNDGTITRFGWKAQNISLLVFSGEAYNVEMGITNEAFMNEREENPNCQTKSEANNVTDMNAATGADSASDILKFTTFMRLLDAPTPSAGTPGGVDSIARGKRTFASTGCALCHTPQLRTGAANLPQLANQPVNLYSDVALHRMGPRLADSIEQGLAQGDEFRTAPLWGLGQRIFFLHDGRTSDLIQAIEAHASGRSNQFEESEANRVIDSYKELPEGSKQDLLNFLRSL